MYQWNSKPFVTSSVFILLHGLPLHVSVHRLMKHIEGTGEESLCIALRARRVLSSLRFERQTWNISFKEWDSCAEFFMNWIAKAVSWRWIRNEISAVICKERSGWWQDGVIWYVHATGTPVTQHSLLKPNDIYIYMSYRSANLQTLHFKYLFNKYTYWLF